MFEDAEQQLERILTLVGKCPEPLQARCFEILLNAYVSTHKSPTQRDRSEGPAGHPVPPPQGDQPNVPAEILNRFRTTAKRIGVDFDKMAGLFDFSSDPFTYHALHVPGDSNAAKTRNVGLLVAAKNYLTTGSWAADMKEIRARCVDQNCYDSTNYKKYLEANPGYFRLSDSNATPTPTGIKAAESLLGQLASEN